MLYMSHKPCKELVVIKKDMQIINTKCDDKCAQMHHIARKVFFFTPCIVYYAIHYNSNLTKELQKLLGF